MILSDYWRKVFQINEDSIIVFIPYNRLRSFNDLVDKVVDKLVDKVVDKFNKTELNFHHKSTNDSSIYYANNSTIWLFDIQVAILSLIKEIIYNDSWII